MASKEQNLSIELKDATVATVQFDQKAMEKGEARPRPIRPKMPVRMRRNHRLIRYPPAAGELLHTISPTELNHSAVLFAEGVSHACRSCGGTGQVQVEVQYGVRQEGVFERPLMRTEMQPCKNCHGAGKIRDSDDALRLRGHS